MLNALNDILKRRARRKDINKQMLDTRPPLITDTKHTAEVSKRFKKLQAQYLDACHHVDADIDVMLKAVELVLDAPRLYDSVEDAIAVAADLIPLFESEPPEEAEQAEGIQRTIFDELNEAKEAQDGQPEPPEEAEQAEEVTNAGTEVSDKGAVQTEDGADRNQRKRKNVQRSANRKASGSRRKSASAG
jgi:cobalamin biosynthesis Mg chelatase CobN